MGMQAGSSEDAITEINVTPLVDVCLVLVIIFMAVAPFAVDQGLKTLQASARAQVGKVAATQNVKVTMTRDGKLAVNGRAVARERLPSVLAGAIAASRDKMVLISAHQKNRVSEVVGVMDVAKQAGAGKVALLKNE